MTASSNMNDLEKHLQRLADEVFANRAVMEKFAIEVTDVMQENVLKSMGNGRNDWTQSGDLKWAIERDAGGFKFNKRTIQIGFGQLDHMNQTKRAAQRASFLLQLKTKKEGAKRATRKGVWVNLRFKPEKELPTWLIAEFGRSGSATKAGGKIPKDFMVNYTPRPEKNILIGPSGKTVGLRKQIFFMATRKRALEMVPRTRLRTHRGIEEGRIFRRGLSTSKNRIFEVMGNAIHASLRDFAMRNGGKVQ